MFMDVLNLMDKKAVKRIAGELMGKDIEIIRFPESGFIMMSVTDSFDTDFYLGEVLVTRAEVKMDGQRGYAMITGDDHEKVIMIAVIDAALKTGDRDRIKKRIEKEDRILVNKRGEEKALIASTKVNFEVMP